MTSFLDIILRGVSLLGQALALGGVTFALLILRPLALTEADLRRRLRRSLGLTMTGTVCVVIAQFFSLTLRLGSLADEAGWPLTEALATPFVRAGLVRLLACAGLAVCCWVVGRRPATRWGWAALLGFALALGGSSAWMSHAVGRLQSRGVLLGFDALHQMAAGVWIGGLIHLIAVAVPGGQRLWRPTVLQRFSGMALAAVATLVAAGVALSLAYVDGVAGLVGTAYGVMVLTKVAVLFALLTVGGMNFLAVRRLSRGAETPPPRLWRFVEVEVGLGITALFAAASLTSLPPAVDIVADRATLAEVASRFSPRWPSLQTPSIHSLLASAAPITDLYATRKPEEYAWSEYNHHWAGLFVLAMGLLATLERTGRACWARHWPLLFLGLAGFLSLRSDPRAWPLGPAGFAESMALADVLQHRVFVLLTAVFGLFEWLVRTGRLPSPRWALVFPLLVAVGGGLLLTHSHAMFNLRAEFLVDVTHVPMGLLGIMIGWSRWLELRLPPRDSRVPGWLWPLALALVGILLLTYREG